MNKIVGHLASLILMIVCCVCVEPQEKRCVGGFELSFFYNDKIWRLNSEVRKACENHHNSRLVKVDRPEITKAIDSVIKIVRTIFYIGGKADKYRRWTWPDGSKIEDENSGYQNWGDGQPNNYGGNENCIIVGRGTNQWKDSRCSERLGYICQRDLDPCITVDSSVHNIHECVATGSTTPQVDWRRNNISLTYTTSQTIYQTIDSNSATLYFEKATIGEAGEYVCAAWIGDDGAKKYSEAVKIKVNGTPSIIDVESFPCNSSLLVSWEPNQHAVGFLHRILAFEAPESTGQVFNASVIPTKHIKHQTEISGLQSETAYTIQILACPENDSCTIITHAALKGATTNGTSRRVTSAHLVQLHKTKTCSVSWEWPYNITKDTAVQFKIILKSSSGNEKNRIVNVTQNSSSYLFEPQEGHSHEVKVQSVESLGVCKKIQAVGYCKGKDLVDPRSSLKIVIPVVVLLIILMIAVLLFLIIRRRRQKAAEENTENRIITNQQASADNDYAVIARRQITNRESQNVYSVATDANVSIAPPSAAVYAVVNKNRDGDDHEYSSVANRQIPMNDAYDFLHSHNENQASTSTSGAVYDSLSSPSGPVSDEYSSISHSSIPGNSTYDSLHGDQNIPPSGTRRPEPESQPVYSVVNKK